MHIHIVQPKVGREDTIFGQIIEVWESTTFKFYFWQVRNDKFDDKILKDLLYIQNDFLYPGLFVVSI